MYRVHLNGLYWSQTEQRFVTKTRSTGFPTWDEAVEAAQEETLLRPEDAWTIEQE